MDKEQAIDLLDNLIGMIEDNQDNDYDMALHMAIEALSRSEFPNSSDCISRQAAIDALYSVDEYNARSVKAIKGLPSAQPEQKKGEWMLGFNNRYLEKYYYCSKCGSRKYEEHKPLDYFCSNCGADMREVQRF